MSQSLVLEPWDRDSNMPPMMMKRWFSGNYDQEITQLFSQDLSDMGQGKLSNWQDDPMGKLATIILCDQFSRNCFKGRAEAFSFDHISLKLSKSIVNNVPYFKSYKLFEQLFILMPLMHSEDIDDCQLCADVFNHIIEHLKKGQHDDLLQVILINRRWCLEHFEIL